MTKANLLNIEGKKLKEIELPKCFDVKIREDIVAKVLETKKTRQPYGADRGWFDPGWLWL